MASTINRNETYTILGSTLQDICDSVSKATGSEDIPVPKIPKMIDGINLKYEDIKDVMFMDYNGDVLYSYDKDDFINNVSTLPAGPTWHSNLTFQEWNWDLADIKTELGKSGACCIGACYTTKDGASHFYIDIQDEADLSVTMYISRQAGQTCGIDWGDGASETTGSNKACIHTYSSLGQYDVKVTGGFNIVNTSYFFRRYPGQGKDVGTWYISNNNFLRRVELGTNALLTAQNSYPGFPYCPNLLSVSVHKDIIDTSLTNLHMQGTFRCCESLRFFVFPKGVGSMTTTIPYALVDAFAYTKSLVTVSFPKNCQVPRCGAFGHSGIKFLYLPYVSSVVCTNASYYPTFTNITGLLRFSWKFDTASIAAANGWYSTFMYDSVLKKVNIEDMPIGSPNRYTLYGCYSLEGELTIPSNVTVLTGENFYSCFNVTKIKLLGDITKVGDVGSSVFSSCYRCTEYDFTNCTAVPVLSNTNNFSNITTNAKIVVPDSLVTAWKSASNWSNSNIASKIIGESEYNAQN